MGAKSAISSRNLGDIEAQAAMTRPFVTRVSVTTILDRVPDDCPLLLKSALDCADHPSGSEINVVEPPGRRRDASVCPRECRKRDPNGAMPNNREVRTGYRNDGRARLHART